MKQPKILVENVNKVFHTKMRDIYALKDITLNVHEHEFVSIVGPSGCGKSTIIRILDNIITPTSGRIVVDDYTYEKEVPTEVIRKFGFVFQQPNLLPWLTVRENLMFPLKVFKDKDPKWAGVVNNLLQIAHMEEYADLYPSALSGGMLQRIGTLRAMSYQPPILLMDEPFGAMDEILREQLDLDTMELWDKLGQTIIFITHNVKEAVFVSDRVYVMATEPGRIIDEVVIDLPRPRTVEQTVTKQFGEYVEYLTAKIGDVRLEDIK